MFINKIRYLTVVQTGLFGLRKRAATGAHAFDTLCAALDIERRLTPPKSPQANGMVERFNGRIEEVLQSHHFRSGEELETTLLRYVWLYNQQLPQSALGSKAPLQAKKDWHKLKPQLFKKNCHITFRDMTSGSGGKIIVEQQINPVQSLTRVRTTIVLKSVTERACLAGHDLRAAPNSLLSKA